MIRPLSVLTLVRGRQTHLDNLIDGLRRQSVKPLELVIANMQTNAPVLPEDLEFPIVVVDIGGADLPLAAARNFAAYKARGQDLVFLDVDCIPSPTLLQSYSDGLAVADVCLMGEVRYLPELPISKDTSFDELVREARRHPARPPPPSSGFRMEPEVRNLWGLSFALPRHSFFMAGGFDERFIGYGGEETDFAERLGVAQVPLAWCAEAMALHQHHALHAPPLIFFDDIVRNARLFFDIWGSWCMEYWLGQFAEMNLIEWSTEEKTLNVLRQPTESEIDAARLPATALWG